MFINFTNHPSEKWSKDQLAAAQQYGEIVDMPFPSIDPSASRDNVLTMATDYAQRIAAMSPNAVLCQGEFTFVFAVVIELKKIGVRVFAACSERCIREYVEDGISKKVAEFKFVRFREY